ncbi:FAR1 DNA binding domain, zinc finger, SWIM-type, MULE transposase domain containing protein, partial [Tanacetum coccineum]
DNQLIEVDLVVDAENLMIENEDQDVDDLIVDTYAKENLVAAPVLLLAAYRTLNTEKGKEVVQERDNVPEYKVLRSLEDGLVECTCRHFLRYEFLCRHVFCVLKNRDIEVIPEKYI